MSLLKRISLQAVIAKKGSSSKLGQLHITERLQQRCLLQYFPLNECEFWYFFSTQDNKWVKEEILNQTDKNESGRFEDWVSAWEKFQEVGPPVDGVAWEYEEVELYCSVHNQNQSEIGFLQIKDVWDDQGERYVLAYSPLKPVGTKLEYIYSPYTQGWVYLPYDMIYSWMHNTKNQFDNWQEAWEIAQKEPPPE